MTIAIAWFWCLKLKHDDFIVELARLVSQISRGTNCAIADAQLAAGLTCAESHVKVDSAISRSQSSETFVSKKCCPVLVWSHLRLCYGCFVT